MRTAKLYRVEHKVTGTGPYWTDPAKINPVLNAMVNRHQRAPEKCPGPNRRENQVTKAHYYAFGSKKALRRWFHLHERYLLNSQGFRVKLYSVPEECVQRNHSRQVLFVRSAATHIASFPLRSF